MHIGWKNDGRTEGYASASPWKRVTLPPSQMFDKRHVCFICRWHAKQMDSIVLGTQLAHGLGGAPHLAFPEGLEFLFETFAVVRF